MVIETEIGAAQRAEKLGKDLTLLKQDLIIACTQELKLNISKN